MLTQLQQDKYQVREGKRKRERSLCGPCELQSLWQSDLQEIVAIEASCCRRVAAAYTADLSLPVFVCVCAIVHNKPA